MARTSDARSPGAGHYVDYDEYVDFQLEKARSHIKATDIFTTVTTLVAAFIGYLLVFVVCDQWVLENGFSDWARGLLLVIVLCGLGTMLVRRVVLPIIRRIHPLYAARMIEKADPNLASNLLNFVDVRQSEEAPASPLVLRAMEKRAAVELSHIDVDEAIDRRPLLRVAYALLAVVVISALYIVFSPKDPFTSVRRALLPAAPIAVATETTISDVTPGDEQVPARALLTVEADVRGRDADQVRILFTTADHKYVDQPVEMRRIDPDLPRFRGVLNGENGRGLLQSLSYSISAGDARTRPFRVDVIQPPSARVDDVRYVFPDYMKLDRRTSAGGNIDGWEGATVTVNATANMPVKSASVVLTDSEDPRARGEEVPMQVSGDMKLTATWKLEFRTDGSFARYYHIEVKNPRGETDPEPAVHTLRIRPDQRPDVALLFPTGNLVGERSKPANAVIPLMIQAADPDFELRSITLKAERNGEEILSERLFENVELGQAYRGGYDWGLARLRLQPRDIIQFWIEARDNRQPVANRAVTPRLDLEISDAKKSADEVQKELAAEKQQQADQLAAADPEKSDGRDEQPGDERGDKRPPERPGERPESAASRPAEDDSRPAANDERSDDRNHPTESREGEKNADRSSETQRSDHRKALERLLKENENEQPDTRNDRAEDQPPQQGEQGGDQRKSAKQGKPGSKTDPNQRGNGDSTRDDNRTDESSNDGGKTERGRPAPGNEGRGEEKTGREPSSPQKGTGEQESSDRPGASGDENRPDALPKSPNGDESKPGEGERREGMKKDPSPDKAGNGERDEPGTGKKSDGEKKPGGKAETDKPDQRDGRKPGEKKSGDDRPNQPGHQDKSDGEEADKPKGDGAAGDDDKVAGHDDSAREKSPKRGTDPASDGTGKQGEPSGEGDADRGKPSPSKSRSGGEKGGDADGGGSQSKPGESAKKQQEGDAQGEEEPTDSTPDARKKKADGTEQGEAEGSDENDPDARKSDKVKRKSDSQPGKTKRSDDPSSDPNRPRESRKQEGGNTSARDDEGQADRAPDGKQPAPQPGRTDDPASDQRDGSPRRQAEKRPGQPPGGGHEEPKGPGRDRPQKSDQPQTGEEGESTASDQGKSGANKEGAGDKGRQPGNTDKSRGEPGNAGDEPGKGSKSQPSKSGNQAQGGQEEKNGSGESKGTGKGEGEPSGQPPKGGDGEGSSDKPGDPSSQGKPGGKSSQPGAAPNSQNSSSSQGGGVSAPPAGRSPTAPEGSADGSQPGFRPQGQAGESAPTAEEEEARLEYARKATNLVLKRLKGQLERGEVDDKLLEEMGWKDINDARQFAKFLEDNLGNTGEDASDEAKAKRLQFEEFLKSLQLGNATGGRQGGTSPERRVQPTSVRNVPVPPEYRQQHENYTKRLSRQRGTAETKPAPAKPLK